MDRIIPIIELLRVMMADPELYRRFQAEPAAVFLEFGIDRPEYFLGVREVQCPVMPPLPPGGEAAESIAHAYWAPWLKGGAAQIEKMGVSATILKNFRPLPPRASLTDAEWQQVVAEAKGRIRVATETMRARRQARGGAG